MKGGTEGKRRKERIGIQRKDVIKEEREEKE